VEVVDVGTPVVIPAGSARKLSVEHLAYGGSLGWKVNWRFFYAKNVSFVGLVFAFCFYYDQLNISC